MIYALHFQNKFSGAVTYNSQNIDLEAILPSIGEEPQQFDLITEETVSANKSANKGINKQRIDVAKSISSIPLKSPLTGAQSDYENFTPAENKINIKYDINKKEPNLDISMQISPGDLEKDGTTFFSECFHSFSSTWNLKFDILQNGNVSVFLVERGYKKPVENLSNSLLIHKYNQNNIPNSSKLINNGQNSLYGLNFKSILFSVSVIDSRFSKEFKIFHSFSKDQNQIIGCENLFNMTQLACQDIIHLKVRISEEILHSAVMHLLASRFYQTCELEEKSDPEIEKKIKYCLLKSANPRISDDKRQYRDDRLMKDHNERRYLEDKHNYQRRHKRYSTPPSVLKRKMWLDSREKGNILIMNYYRNKIWTRLS